MKSKNAKPSFLSKGIFSIIFFTTLVLLPGKASAYRVNEYNLNSAIEAWRKHNGDDTTKAFELKNRQETEPIQNQRMSYPTGGGTQQGGLNFSGGNSLSELGSDNATKNQNQRYKPKQNEQKTKTWYNYHDTDHPQKEDGPFRLAASKYNVDQGETLKQTLSNQFTKELLQQQIQDNNPDGIISASDAAHNTQLQARLAGDMQSYPHSKFSEGQAAGHGAAQGASEALSDAFDPTWIALLDLYCQPLINVANEASGSRAGASQATKTYNHAIGFIQRMYSKVYVPIALLFLLPGAVLTQVKGLVARGVLQNQNDDDGVSPFSGILRSLIAIFLIPATQVILSYCIDVGNSLTDVVSQHVEPGLIFMWSDEQVFRAPVENAKNIVQNPSMFAVLGKLSQGAEQESGVESQSTATVMLQALANLMAQSTAFGLVMLCAFQIVMACYLMLMGPLAASFYAWPTGIGSLFNRVFPAWVDAVINLSLWRFWWAVVLLCMDARLHWLEGSIKWTSEWELLMFIAFLVILSYVPFNPFDFKAGDMVSQIMQKAEQCVGEASQGK